MNILFLIGGLILILLGANGLTDGAASVAKRLRIPSIVIGLTIVAFGTSAPELTVSVSSALKGSADIAIGNVVGSNIFNTLMIVGCTANYCSQPSDNIKNRFPPGEQFYLVLFFRYGMFFLSYRKRNRQ